MRRALLLALALLPVWSCAPPPMPVQDVGQGEGASGGPIEVLGAFFELLRAGDIDGAIQRAVEPGAEEMRSPVVKELGAYGRRLADGSVVIERLTQFVQGDWAVVVTRQTTDDGRAVLPEWYLHRLEGIWLVVIVQDRKGDPWLAERFDDDYHAVEAWFLQNRASLRSTHLGGR